MVLLLLGVGNVAVRLPLRRPVSARPDQTGPNPIPNPLDFVPAVALVGVVFAVAEFAADNSKQIRKEQDQTEKLCHPLAANSVSELTFVA